VVRQARSAVACKSNTLPVVRYPIEC
jgi:hypothetical protein